MGYNCCPAATIFVPKRELTSIVAKRFDGPELFA
jgi:hypothetical protein